MDEAVKTGAISCIAHAGDSPASFEAALRSVNWVEELIVVDEESDDAILAIARRYTNRILSTKRVSRGDAVKNRYFENATNPWVLILDSDEHLAADAEEAIRTLIAEQGNRYDAFAIPRFNYIAGQIMRGSGWYPDPQVRLFRKDAVPGAGGTDGSTAITFQKDRLMTLAPPGCLHIHRASYRDLSDFITKQVALAVSDRYDSDPANFHFDDYVARAYENLAFRRDPERDGDLSHALALLMAWEAIIRGLIHWDRLQPRPPLPDLVALPIVENNQLTEKNQQIMQLQASLAWKFAAALRELEDRFLPAPTRRRRLYDKCVHAVKRLLLEGRAGS